MFCVFEESLKRVTWYSLRIWIWGAHKNNEGKQGEEINICLWKGWPEGPTETMRGNQYMFCVFESLRNVDLVLLVYLRGQWWGGGGGGEEEGHSGPWPSFRWSCPCWDLWSQKIEKSSCKNSTDTLAGVRNEIRYSVKKFKLYKMLLLLGFLSVEPNYNEGLQNIWKGCCDIISKDVDIKTISITWITCRASFVKFSLSCGLP